MPGDRPVHVVATGLLARLSSGRSHLFVYRFALVLRVLRL